MHKDIPNFASALERQEWFIKNADYFTAITRLNRQNIRVEKPTLMEAEAYARDTLTANPQYRSFLLYAVVGMSDSFVRAVMPQ